MPDVQGLAEALFDEWGQDLLDYESWIENAQYRQRLRSNDTHCWLPVLQFVEGQVLHHFFEVLWKLADEARDIEIRVRSVR